MEFDGYLWVRINGRMILVPQESLIGYKDRMTIAVFDNEIMATRALQWEVVESYAAAARVGIHEIPPEI